MADHSMHMTGVFGPYSMTREASGTSWQPDSALMDGTHDMSGNWMTMWHGSMTGVYTHQAGPRGDEQTFSESMLMFMARRAMGEDVFGFRAMISLEPTMGARGYPLLFQTGESANGRDPLIDRQHPHNLLMEMAASYNKSLSSDSSLFIYGGPVGEPALGPPAFMHRFSSLDNPEAPLTHHWLDATHITFGVITLGAVWRDFKIEGSVFNGREPNEHRYDVQIRGLDSSAIRLSYNPTKHLSLQVSAGRLASPEELEPEVAVKRTTASAIYDLPFAAKHSSMHWQTTIAWGRDAPDDAHGDHANTDGYLLDSALSINSKHTIFTRYEHVMKDELFVAGEPMAGNAFLIQKASIGYAYAFAQLNHFRFSIGGVASKHWIPAELSTTYGSNPNSYSLFLRAALIP